MRGWQLREDTSWETRPRWHTWVVALLVLAAVAVRLYRLHCSSVGLDGAVVGLLGLGVLAGRWPLFFYGQDFMGALDGYLAAPVYALFGPSTLTLNIWAPILSLATLAVLYRCLRRYLPPLPSLVALAYMALPPAMAYWHAGKPNNHYPMGILLCALLLWLSFRLWEQRPWRKGTAFCWGLVAGLALWTNFQTVVVIWACMLFLALTCLPRLRPLALLSGLAGAILGATPLIYYNLLHQGKHLEQSGSFAWQYLAPHGDMLWKNALPIVLGFNTPAAGGVVAPGSPWFALYLAVAACLAVGMLLLLWRSRRPEGRWALLPVLVVFMSLAVLVGSIYGREMYDWDLRYLLPLYLGLPFAWAALAQGLGRWGKGTVLVMGGLLLALNLSGWAGYGGGVLTCGRRPFRCTVEPKEREFIASLRQAGFSGLYLFTRDLYRLAFYAGETPQFADAWGDRRQYAANQVDADPRAAVLDAPQESLRFLGLEHQVWRGRVFHRFKPPQGAAAPLPRHDWRFYGVGGAQPGRSLMDGDLRTGLELAGPRDSGKGFLLDLGQTRTVGGLVLVPPDYRTAPGSLRVEGAGEDGEFQVLRQMTNAWQPCYWSATHPFFKARYARVECYFPPRPLRYLRVIHQAVRPRRHHCLIAEVLLLGPARDQADTISWPESARLVAEVARSAGVKRVYADAWLSAYLALALGPRVWTLPANYTSNDYGDRRPPAEEPLVVDTSPGSALVVPAAEAGQAQAALSRAGVAFRSHRAGRVVVLLLRGRPGFRDGLLPLSAVSSDIDPAKAAQLARGVPAGGRWGSLVPQQPGMSLTVDLGRARQVARVRLWNPHFPRDYPRGLAVLLSNDGQSWQEAPLNLTAPLVYSGRGLFAAAGAYGEYALVKPRPARYLRLVLTKAVKTWWWSVERLEVLSR